MREGAEFRELMLQIVRTRMAFRRSMQRTLRKNNAGITFEMLQVLSSLWHEQGIRYWRNALQKIRHVSPI